MNQLLLSAHTERAVRSWSASGAPVDYQPTSSMNRPRIFSPAAICWVAACCS
jgi:hypothetical protein